MRTFGLRAAGVVLLLGPLLSCGGETSLLLAVKGSFADARALHFIVVREGGPDTMTYDVAATADKPLALPGTVLLKSSDDARLLGVFVWATDANNRIIAAARSTGCFKVEAHAQSKYEITLEVPPIGWRPDDSRNCACKPSSPGADMCMGALPDAGQSDASPLGTGGLGSGGTAGSSSTGGAGGSLATGGTGGAAGMGGVIGTGGGGGMGGTPPAAMLGTLWGFEEMGGWVPTGATVTNDTAKKKQGTASLLVTPSTPMVQLTSRAFKPSEIGGTPTGKVGLDVYVVAPPPDGLFVALWMECKSAALYGYFVDNYSLKAKGVQANTWSRLVWPIKAEAVTALGTATDCVMRFDFAGLNQTIQLDNLSFDP